MSGTPTDELAQWGDAAGAYARFVDGDVRRTELLLPALRALLGELGGRDVLDLGCGTGSDAAWMAARGARVTAVDGVPAFVEATRAALAPFPGARAVLHDLRAELPEAVVPGRSTDLVVASMLVSSLPDLEPLLRSVARVLRPGGRLVLSTLHPAFTPPAAKVHAGLLGRIAHRLRRVVVLDYFTEKRLSKGIQGSRIPPLPYHHRTLETLVTSLAACGLVITGLREPRPSDHSAIARTRALNHALRVPLFVLLEAQLSR